MKVSLEKDCQHLCKLCHDPEFLVEDDSKLIHELHQLHMILFGEAYPIKLYKSEINKKNNLDNNT